MTSDTPTITPSAQAAIRDEIAATVAGLAAFADWLDRHPDIALDQYSPAEWIVADHQMTDPSPAEITRALKDGGQVTKKGTDATLFLERDFGGGVQVQYQAKRAEVCEAVVVGQETVEIPDPDAPKVTVTRDVIEWKCAPILAEAPA